VTKTVRPLSDYPDLLTITEYASIVRRGRRQCYEDVRLGRVPSVRLGGAIRIPRGALERMLQAAAVAEEPPLAAS
jgi:excisionase family DNA binding protein